MSKKNYEMIPVKKPVDGKELLDNIVIYLYSRLSKNWQIETNISENTHTILVSSTSDRKVDQGVYITVEYILHSDSCVVSFASSKRRPVFEFALAVVAAPIALPASGIYAGFGLLGLWNHYKFKKDVIRYIETYVNH